MPCSAISFAALMKPAQAVRASEPPTLIRRTPRSAASCTERPERADQKIDRLWMHGLHDRGDLFLGLDARRIEAIGAGVRIGLQPVDHHVQIGLPPQEPLAAAGQQHAAVVGIDRRARRLDALDRKAALVKRLCRVAGGILDRQSGDAGLDRARDIGADLSGFMRKAALEIGIDGQIDRRAQRGEMRPARPRA